MYSLEDEQELVLTFKDRSRMGKESELQDQRYTTRYQYLKELARNICDELTNTLEERAKIGAIIDGIPYEEFMAHNVVLLVVGLYYNADDRNGRNERFDSWTKNILKKIKKVSGLETFDASADDIIRYIHITDPHGLLYTP